MQNEIEISDGWIIIQSCDKSWANIGVMQNDKMAYREVDLPSLLPRWHRESLFGELDAYTFRRTLQENRDAILKLIASLV